MQITIKYLNIKIGFIYFTIDDSMPNENNY